MDVFISKRQYVLQIILLVMIIFSVGHVFFARFRLGLDTQDIPCLPNHRLYLIDTYDKVPQNTHLYAFYAKNLMPIYPDRTLLLKRVVGSEGQRVQITNESVFIDKKKISQGFLLAKQLNLNGDDFTKEFEISTNNYWFTGDIAESFDSRYFGTVDGDLIYGRAYPLW
ncbi:signal peptidase I [Thorsellia kenyensis]|uniref:Signal peptidase I n=1 Tax=Thorsellia kenyensis TaxID=1549888 RepID=A0ABV6CD86_9GAMM